MKNKVSISRFIFVLILLIILKCYIPVIIIVSIVAAIMISVLLFRRKNDSIKIKPQKFHVDNISEWYCPECDYKNPNGHICKSCGYEAEVVTKREHITDYSAEALGVMTNPTTPIQNISNTKLSKIYTENIVENRLNDNKNLNKDNYNNNETEVITKQNHIIEYNTESVNELKKTEVVSNRASPQKGNVFYQSAVFDDETIEKLNERYIAFDVETTGLNSYTDRIIELGAVLFENQVPVKEFSTLVNPNVYIPSSATAVNHITNSMISTAPEEDKVYPELVQFLGDALQKNTIICAHNARFDMGFLSETLMRLGYNANIFYLDTLSLSRRTILGVENYKQPTLAAHFGIINEQDHRAASDAKVCGIILSKILSAKQEEQKELLIRKEQQAEAERLKKEELQKLRDDYIQKRGKITINPVHNRKPLCEIAYSKYGFNKGYEYWFKGDTLRKEGDNEQALELFDKARESGYNAPALYLSYARAYHRLKDYDNEIAILDEAIERNIIDDEFEIKRYKAVCIIIKHQEKIIKDQEKKQKKTEEQMRKQNIVDTPRKIIGRAVIQFSDNMTVIKKYDTLSEASRETGVSSKCIRDAAKGIQKHAGGFVWKYADEITQDTD